jgi:hypothetical protein
MPGWTFGYNDRRRIAGMADENNYSAPNRVRFKVSVSKRAKWHCAECGQEGYTDDYEDDGDDAAESKAEASANEHSLVCPAGRGSRPRSV